MRAWIYATTAFAAVGAAHAQTAAPPQAQTAPAAADAVGDIVVTANRREERLQDVGISVAAFTGDQLRTLQVQTAGDVAQLTPNFEAVRSYAAPGFNTQFTIRGVGQPDFQDTTEATTTTYVDEFYMIGAGQADFLAFDVQRVEVARGPQGTVQGRNATGGSVNFYTNRPDTTDTSGRASVSIGEFGLVRADAVLNLPLNDKVALRGAIATDQATGYLRNINPRPLWRKGGQNDFTAGRLQLLMRPSEDVTIILKGEIGELGPVTAQNEKMYPTGPIPGRVGTFRQERDAFGQSLASTGQLPVDLVNADGPYEIGHKLWHVLGRLDWRANDQLSFVVVGGWLRSKKFEVEDCDHTPLPLCLFSNSARSEHTSVEARALYDLGGFRLTAGANYLDQSIRTRSATPLFFGPTVTPFPNGLLVQAFNDNQTLKSWAVFGQAEYDLTRQLTLIAGIRYTHDDKRLDAENGTNATFPLTTQAPVTLEQFLALNDFVFSSPATSLTNLNQRDNGDLAVFDKGLINANVQINWKPTEDILLYAAYRRGVKSGGFVTGNVAGTPANLRKFREETNNAYELGAKTTWFDGKLRLNGAFFYYDYVDMQNTSFIGITNVITNNDATVLGGELELAATPVRGLNIQGGIGIVDSKVKGIVNPTGAVTAVLDNRLPLAPTLTANYVIRYDFGFFNGTAFAQTSGRGRTFMFRDSLNNQSTRIPGIFTADAIIGYSPPGGKWTLSAFVRNIFDRREIINAFDLSGVGGSGEVVYSLPRWAGGTLAVNF